MLQSPASPREAKSAPVHTTLEYVLEPSATGTSRASPLEGALVDFLGQRGFAAVMVELDAANFHVALLTVLFSCHVLFYLVLMKYSIVLHSVPRRTMNGKN
jgi:hypothetical protein